MNLILIINYIYLTLSGHGTSGEIAFTINDGDSLWRKNQGVIGTFRSGRPYSIRSNSKTKTQSKANLAQILII